MSNEIGLMGHVTKQFFCMGIFSQSKAQNI